MFLEICMHIYLVVFAFWARATPKFLERSPPNFLVILCLERQYPKQNSVIRLKLNILTPPNFFVPQNFWPGYASAVQAHLFMLDCTYSTRHQRSLILQL